MNNRYLNIANYSVWESWVYWKSKTARTEHVGDYYKGNSFITRGIWLWIFITIVNDTYSDTSRCTLKCINKENMVLNLNEKLRYYFKKVKLANILAEQLSTGVKYDENTQMIKIIIIALFAGALVLFAMRFLPALRFQIQRLFQNPFVRAMLFRGLWRLIRLLIFRR